LVTTVPTGAATGTVAVTVGTATATSTESFVVDSNGLPPTITSVTPSIVDSGATVIIAGQYLDPVPGQTSVTLDGQTIATTSVTDTAISFVAPQNVGSGRVTVQTPFGLVTSATDLIVASWFDESSIGTTGRIQIGASQILNIPAWKNGVLLFDAADIPTNTWLSFQLNALSGTTSLTYNVFDSQNHQVASGSLSAASPSLHLPQLIQPGTYSIYFEPNSSSTVSLTVGLESDPQLALNTSAATSVATVIANQTKRYWFVGSPGTALVFPAVSTNPSGSTVSVTLEDAYGQNPVYSLPSASPFALNMPFLVAGVYQAIVTPGPGATENTSMLYQSQPGAALTIDGPTVSTTASPLVNATYSFAATTGDHLELALSGVTAGELSVSVYDPGNNEVASTGCSSGNPAGSCSLSLSAAVTGNYSIVVTVVPGYKGPDGLTGYQITLTRDITGTLVNGQSQTFNLSRPGQSLRLSFDGTMGDKVAIGLSNSATIPAGNDVAMTVLQPDGTTLDNAELGANGAVNLANLAQTGVYTVLVNPDYGLPASLQLELMPDPSGTLMADGPSQPISTSFAGQDAYFSFTAEAGDNLELGLSGLTMNEAYGCVDVNVYDTNDNYVSSSSWSPSSPAGSSHVSLWNLAGGAYSIVLAPCDGQATFSGTLTLTHDVTGTLTMGSSVPINLTRPGQVERLNFVGTTGQTLAVALDSPITTPASNNITLEVLNPDGSEYTYTDVSTASAINLPNLSATGTYTVIVSPDYGLPASLQLTLTSNTVDTLVPDGPSQSVSNASAGQNAYAAFTAAAGDNLEGLSSLTMNGGTYDCVNVNVYDANNNYVGDNSWFPSSPAGSSHVSLWNLAGGAYSIVLAPCDGQATFSGTLTLTRDVASALAVGSPQSINLARSGQIARLSFAATAGQTLSVALDNPVTAPAGNSITLEVLSPDGTQYASTDVSSASAINLPNFSTTGIYTVIVSPDYGLPATAQVSLLPQDGGPLTANGAAQAVATTNGQNAYLSFTAAAGDNLELGLSGLTVNGASTGCVDAQVYSATSYAGSVEWSASNPGGSEHIELWNLAAGAYTISLAPCSSSDAFSGTLTLTSDLTGSLTTGTPLTVALAQPGQTARLSFSAAAGQTLTATFGNVVTTPSGQYLNYWVLNPDGSQWGSGTVYSNQVSLQNLPTTGTYQLIVDGYYGVPASMTVSLQ